MARGGTGWHGVAEELGVATGRTGRARDSRQVFLDADAQHYIITPPLFCSGQRARGSRALSRVVRRELAEPSVEQLQLAS